MISVVFPAKNEEQNVEELHRRIKRALDATGEAYEIIAVDDGSTDRTLLKLKSLSPLRTVVLARNYGQSSALDAGIAAARGEIIVITDADLQNDPADIPSMFKKMQEGYDAVLGWRQNRHDTLGRRLFSRFANWLARRILGLALHDYACGIKMFKKECMRGVRLYGEMHVFLAAILHYHGARIVEIPVAHHERTRGISKHTFIKGAKDIADLLTIKFLMSTSRPLLFFGTLGLISGAVGVGAGIWATILKIMRVRNFAQTPLPVIASFFVIAGLLLFMMGFLAELLLRAYYEGRKEAHYVIREILERHGT